MAKGLISDEDDHSAAAARSLSLSEADVVILIGARLNWMLSHGAAPTFNPDAKFVQLEMEATEFDSNQKIAAPLQGDLNSILTKLVPALKKADYHAPTDWLAAIKAKTAENVAKFAKRVEAGETNAKFGYYGALMGVGLGYAIATAIETGKPVVALEGDSAFGFDGMEMETICRYHLPITVVIVNNGGIYNGTDREVADQPGPTMLDATARYEYMAKAFGGDSYFVSSYQEMKVVFEQAVASKRPNIINVQIDPSMGKESGHIGNLNPKLDLKK